MTESTRPRLCVLTPTRDGLSEPTQYALRENMDGFDFEHFIVSGKPVIDARNELADLAMEWAGDDDDAVVLCIDDDAWWPQGAIARLVSRLLPGPRLLTGVACWRDEMLPTNVLPNPTTELMGRMWRAQMAGNPLSRQEIEDACRAIKSNATLPDPKTAESEIVRIVGLNGTFFMVTKSVFEIVSTDIFRCPPFWSPGDAEDTWFGLRCYMRGIPVECDPAVLIGHVDPRNNAIYFAQRTAMELRDGQIVPFSGPRLPYQRRRYGFKQNIGEELGKQVLELLGATVYY